MIFQCPSCRVLADVTEVQIAETRAGLCCPSCQSIHWLPAAHIADRQKPAPADIDLPPQASSGASAAPMLALRADLEALPPPGEGFDFLQRDFLALLANWEDANAHQALVQKASALSQLPALGVRYRLVLERHPDDPAAKRAQQQILQMAFAALPLRSEAEPGGRTVTRYVAALVSLFALGLSLWYWIVVGPGH